MLAGYQDYVLTHKREERKRNYMVYSYMIGAHYVLIFLYVVCKKN
jgi:hypothetical protein